VDRAASASDFFVKEFVESGGGVAIDGDVCGGVRLADDIEGAGDGAAVVLVERVGDVGGNPAVGGGGEAVADFIEGVGVVPSGL
jgi:hypothetical protein